MKTLHLAIIAILIASPIGNTVNVFADNGTLILVPPSKIPIRQVNATVLAAYLHASPFIHGISLTLVGTEQRLGGTLTIAGTFLPNSQIELDLHAPDGRIIQNETTMTNKMGIFSSFDLKIPASASSGIWNVNATSGSMFEDMQFNVEPQRPLKQLASGVDPRQIQCDLGFLLIIKSEDGTPACVRPDTAQKLVERGWAKETVSSSVEKFPNLKLNFSTNASSISSSRAIGIDISLNNTNSGSFSLKARDHWPRDDLSLGSCSNLPIGIAILKGYYTLQNMSGASSLWLYPNLPCPPMLLGTTGYTFQPLSDMATRECSSSFSCHDYIAIKGHLAIGGYLVDNDHANPFQPGNYTIVGGDEWGDVAIRHFVVINSTIFAGDTGTISCPPPIGIDTKIVNSTGFAFNFTSKYHDTFVLTKGESGKIMLQYSYPSMAPYRQDLVGKPLNITIGGGLIYIANVTSGNKVSSYEINIYNSTSKASLHVCNYKFNPIGMQFTPCFPDQVSKVSQLGPGPIPYNPGIGLHVEPKWVMVYPNATSTFNATISSDKGDALSGTYWVWLGQGLCNTGTMIKLVIP